MIGIHNANNNKFYSKVGFLLRDIIKEYNENKFQKNEIIITIETPSYYFTIEQLTFYFMDNTNNYFDKETGENHFHDNLKEFSESNLKIYFINNNI